MMNLWRYLVNILLSTFGWFQKGKSPPGKPINTPFLGGRHLDLTPFCLPGRVKIRFWDKPWTGQNVPEARGLALFSEAWPQSLFPVPLSPSPGMISRSREKIRPRARGILSAIRKEG